jgi:hypothetical protein
LGHRGRDPAAPKTGLGLVDETDADYIAQLFRQATPFYVAADYRRPPGAAPAGAGAGGEAG